MLQTVLQVLQKFQELGGPPDEPSYRAVFMVGAVLRCCVCVFIGLCVVCRVPRVLRGLGGMH